MVRTRRPRRPKRIGSGRIVGCCCLLSMIDGRLWRKSPLNHTMAVSRLALGRKQRTMVAGSLAEGMMGKRGTVGGGGGGGGGSVREMATRQVLWAGGGLLGSH